MGLHVIKKGLDIPISGKPSQQISGEKLSSTYALLGSDYIGMKPTMMVSEGDTVKIGQTLFTDKKMPEVGFTSPVNGKITKINRGDKRVFVSIEIQETGKDEITFQSFSATGRSPLPHWKLILHWVCCSLRPSSERISTIP
ncbi:MAG: hypothetical protein COS35_07640 [Zetaproteobacteria bacterium CG02_land_8_20_14_3_00_50_9]|nr:MAG: hypothetical protein COS35_07640 [Zetaproteobacteria bacterium CG02_land_8_20_14_3_00_50_9]